MYSQISCGSIRLDKSAGSFVDIIHTDSGEYGLGCPAGHIDFFPNNGIRIQPFCKNSSVSDTGN